MLNYSMERQAEITIWKSQFFVSHPNRVFVFEILGQKVFPVFWGTKNSVLKFK